MGPKVERNVVCYILAGGLSTRMGQDKSRVRLGRRTLLGYVRVAAAATGWPVKVIRKDKVERCGPLGGVLTALTTNRADTLVFLSCDMPFITADWLQRLVRELERSKAQGVFTQQEQFAGFPFVVKSSVLAEVEALRGKGQHSLQALARQLAAQRVDVPADRVSEFLNVNTPMALAEAKRLIVSKRP